MIIANLNIKPGSIVIETGTGTGSLSTAFITSLQPNGRLHTFEYHKIRADSVIEDFKNNKLLPWVTAYHRDTIKMGFPSELDEKADAVFLDLPAPWSVVLASKKALKPNALFCSFSPCIEQIQKTAECLTEQGFVNIETIECLQKAYDVRLIEVKKDIDDWDVASNLLPNKKTILGDFEKNENKEPHIMQIDLMKADLQKSDLSKQDLPKETKSTENKNYFSNFKRKDKNSLDFKLLARPFNEMRGHTGYLIFARKYNKK